MSYLDKIRACNAWDPGRFLPFFALEQRVGSLRPALAAELRRWPDRFRVGEDRVDWVDPPGSFPERSALIEEVLGTLVHTGVIAYLQGEPYPLTAGRREEALCLIDRAAAPYFGARAFGQHLNGFVRGPEGIELWIGRRSADRRIDPLHLDNLVAGGLPFGVPLEENLLKECREEADIPPGLARQALAVGAVTYCRESEQGLKPDVMYCYDLELPQDFVPRCTDGEVESFHRLPAAEVARLVRDTDAFKLNCNLVIIDFLIRNGLVPQEDPDYLAILQGLRSPLP
jgi:8-oxo-dGTP pyrophosphatase MutT (NUDIX family)